MENTQILSYFSYETIKKTTTHLISRKNRVLFEEIPIDRDLLFSLLADLQTKVLKQNFRVQLPEILIRSLVKRLNQNLEIKNTFLVYT